MNCPFFIDKSERPRCEVVCEMDGGEPSSFPLRECRSGSHYDCPLFKYLCVNESERFREIEDPAPALAPNQVRHVNRAGGFRSFLIGAGEQAR